MRSPVRVAMLATMTVAIALLALSTPAAAQESDGFYLRVGGLSEGPQHTFKKGVELGAGWDWHRSPAFALGVGGGLAHQGSKFQYEDFDARMLSIETHVRWTIGRARVRPLAELGLGYYFFRMHSQWPGYPAFRDDWAAPGAWLGIGASVRLTENLAVRPGVAYHGIAQAFSIDSGNAEDYFATGITLAYGIPRR